MGVVYRHSIEVCCVTPGDPKRVQAKLLDRAFYDERVAKCMFCSNEPVTNEIVLMDDDKQYYFLIEDIIRKRLNLRLFPKKIDSLLFCFFQNKNHAKSP